MIDRSFIQTTRYNRSRQIPCSKKCFGEIGTAYLQYVEGNKIHLIQTADNPTSPYDFEEPVIRKIKLHGQGRSRTIVMAVPANFVKDIGCHLDDYLTTRIVEPGHFTLEKSTKKEIKTHSEKAHVKAISGKIVNRLGYMYFTPEEREILGSVKYGDFLKVTVNAADKAYMQIETFDNDTDSDLLGLRESMKGIDADAFFSIERIYKFRMTDCFRIPSYLVRKFEIEPGNILNVCKKDNSLIIELCGGKCDICGKEVSGCNEQLSATEICYTCSKSYSGVSKLLQRYNGDFQAAVNDTIKRLEAIVNKSNSN